MTAHHFWINAAARNIAETTATTGRCRFMRTMPRAVDVIDLIVCAAIAALVVIYEVT